MDCRCGRMHVSPCTWNSKDGQWTFHMDRHGITDMLPGPSHRLLTWLRKDYPAVANLLKGNSAYSNGSDHVHWALPDND
jgi:hypothetical protein